MRPVKIDTEWLVEQYVGEQRGGPEIARELGCSTSTVWRRLRDAGVEIRPKAQAMQLARGGRLRTPELERRAAELYKEGHSASSIARRLRLGKTDVFTILLRQGVKTRSKAEASVVRRNAAQRVHPKASDLRGLIDRCALCGTDMTLEIHHINGDAGDNDRENLIALCWEHHTFVEFLIGQAIVGFRRRYLASPR